MESLPCGRHPPLNQTNMRNAGLGGNPAVVTWTKRQELEGHLSSPVFETELQTGRKADSGIWSLELGEGASL